MSLNRRRKAKLKKAIEDAQGIDVAHADGYTVGSWLRSWYGLYAQPNIRTTTVRNVQLILHCAFERAVKERLIQRNLTEDCIASKIQRKEMSILKPEDISAYLTAAENTMPSPCFIWNWSAD